MAYPALTPFRTVAAACEHSVARNKSVSIQQTLASLVAATGDNEQADVYGSGALIAEFELEVAELLGKPAAVFMPSGTMAQPIAMRIWADRAKTPYVALPATSHLALHEYNSYQVLWGLQGITLGQAHLVPTLDDLKASAHDPLAAVLLELPMREIGGQLPSWDELVAQSEWAREQGIKLHMDGARLWQCPAAYDRSLAEISALFDSVYVSFYKDLGGISGAILAGDEDFIAAARIWQRRAGGNLYALYPYVIAAREGLKQHLPQMAERAEQARWYAEQLNTHSAFSTWPAKPQTNMFRLRVNCNPDTFIDKAVSWMKEHRVALITPPYQVNEDSIMCELTFGDAFNSQSREQWQYWLDKFVSDVL